MRTPDDREGRRFMVRTQHGNLEASDQQRGVAPPPLFRYVADGDDGITLPDQKSMSDVPFQNVVSSRESVRSYADAALSLDQLSFLLQCTAGVKKTGKIHTMRTVPSAGARHAIDTAIFVNRVDGVAPGLYGYAPGVHRLVPHNTPDENLNISTLCSACFDQSFILDAAVLFLWIATPYRMNWRYGVRGYRYLHLDAGHICQNLYLAAESIGGGVCAIAAYDDERLNAALGLNGTDEFVIYLAAAGLKHG